MEKPFPAYAGSEPFIFVCYSHDDADLVYPEIRRLQESGFHLWYDEGISPGAEWSKVLAQSIEQCTEFLYFVTPTSVVRENCRRELNFALDQRCAILAVHLEETDVPSALKLSLSHRQAILRYEHSRPTYEEKLDQAIKDAAIGRPDTLSDSSARTLQIGDWVLNVGSQRLIREHEVHALLPKDMDVLVHLAEAAPDLVTMEALLERNWAGSVVGGNTLHHVIGRLRKVLGDDAHKPSYLETLPRRGYRLMVPVAEARADVDHAPLVAESASSTTVHTLRRMLSGRPRVLIASASILILGFVTALVIFEQQSPAISEDQPSIGDQASVAVVPFDSASGDDGARFLATGLTRALRSQLMDFRGISVVDFEEVKVTSPDQEVANPHVPEHLIKGAVRTSPGRIHVEVRLVRTIDGTPVYTEAFERESDQLLVVENDIVDMIVAALQILLDEDKRQQMLNQGTKNARAFLAVQESHRLMLQPTAAGGKAIGLLNQAIALDPDYVNAYVRLLVVYGNARLVVDAETRARLTQGIERLLPRLETLTAGTGDPIFRWVRSRVSVDLLEIEADLRYLIVNPVPQYSTRCGPSNVLDDDDRLDHSAGCHWRAHLHYARLLVGADLPHVAAAFLERARTEGGFKNVWTIYGYVIGANIAELLIGPEASVRLLKMSLENNPAYLPVLAVIIRSLTILGRHEEAGHYLDQLYQYDSQPFWAHNVDHVRRARMGELRLDSPELLAFLDNPLSTPLFKSRVLLLLGDVERGVEQMRQLPTEMLRSYMDHSLPPEVVADPRYRAVLEELGVGDSWRQYLIEKIKEMEPHTGIGFPTRVSVSMADIYRSAGDE